MPLDPQARQFLDMIEAAGNPPLQEMTVEEARQSFVVMSGMGSRPGDRAGTQDRTVPGPGGDIPVRLYTPPGEGPLPLVMFFHGGGFTIGSIETHDGICHQLATGVPAIVVSVDYRMGPEHPFPAAVEDCWAATQWVAEHAGEIGGDPARLAVAGDSAGGNLASVVAIRARDRGGPALRFQLLIYPGVDMTRSLPSHQENGQGYLLTSDSIDWFMQQYLGPHGDLRHPEASPLFADDVSGLPPALVLTAEFDPLRDEGEAYAARLRDAGVDATATRYDGMIHAFFGMDAFFDASARAVKESVEALALALR